MIDTTQARVTQPSMISATMSLASEDTSAFSTNYVIAFARARTNHINTWLNRQLTSMRSAARDSQALNDALAGLALYSEGFGGKDEDKWDALQGCQDALTKAIKQLPADSPLAAKLTNLRDHGALTGGGDAWVSKEQMSGIIKEVENELKAVDRGSQEAQLYINQKMGEKNEILQLAAMLLQQFNETAKAMLQRS